MSFTGLAEHRQASPVLDPTEGHLILFDELTIRRLRDGDLFLTRARDVADFFDVPHAVRGVFRVGKEYHRGGSTAALAAIRSQADDERIPISINYSQATCPGFLVAVIGAHQTEGGEFELIGLAYDQKSKPEYSPPSIVYINTRGVWNDQGQNASIPRWGYIRGHFPPEFST